MAMRLVFLGITKHRNELNVYMEDNLIVSLRGYARFSD
jgi:hypothetical protein